MTKKINPKDQTTVLSQARYEALDRNPIKKKEYEEREHIASLRESARIFFGISEKEFEELYKNTFMSDRAASEIDLEDILFLEIIPKLIKEKDQKTELLKSHWLRYIFDQVKKNTPRNEKDILVKIDLSRSKEVIEAELKSIVSEAQKRKNGKKPVTRLKWLSNKDDIWAIWDAWLTYGQRRCFNLIAEKMKLPESTVKYRWRLAYSLIHGEEYSKEVAAKSADKLCANCQYNGKCYRTVNGVMDFYPCVEYLKLTGKSYTRENLSENFEEIADQHVLKESGISKKTVHKNRSI